MGPAPSIEHAPELDGVRGAAILLILYWHYFCNLVVAADGTAAWWLVRAGNLSWSGVDLFFVLSGYLLGTILIRHRGGENFYAAFYARRVCRIIPLYLLLLAAYLACAFWLRDPANRGHQWLFNREMPFWSYASFTQNILMGQAKTFGANFLAVTWSLAVEEHFYLLLPVTVAVLPPRLLPWVLGAVIGAAPFVRSAIHGAGWEPFMLTPARMDSMAAGVLLAAMLQRQEVAAWFRSQRRFLGWLLALLGAGLAVQSMQPRIFGDFNLTWIAAFYALLVALCVTDRGGAIAAWLRTRWLTGLGILSYSVYLFHQPVNGLVHATLYRDRPRIDSIERAAATLLALGITIGVAMITMRLIERPAIRLGRRISYGAPA